MREVIDRAVVAIGPTRAVEEEATIGMQTDPVLPSLDTAALEIPIGEIAMFPEVEAAAGGAIAAVGSDDEVARHPSRRLGDLALGAAVRLAAIAVPGALHAAREGPPDIETRERDLGLLVGAAAAMLTGPDGNHAMGEIAAMPGIDARFPQSAPRLRLREDGSLHREVGRESTEDATRLLHPPVRGAPRKHAAAAAAPTAAAIDPLIASAPIHPHDADRNAAETATQTSRTMTVADADAMAVTKRIPKPRQRARNLKGRDAIAPLRPRLRQTVASLLIFWKMNRVPRKLSWADFRRRRCKRWVVIAPG